MTKNAFRRLSTLSSSLPGIVDESREITPTAWTQIRTTNDAYAVAFLSVGALPRHDEGRLLTDLTEKQARMLYEKAHSYDAARTLLNRE